MADGDFEEEEVWSFVKERKHEGGRGRSFLVSSSPSPSCSFKRIPSSSRLIPRANGNAEENGTREQRQSAPVDIPDWPKIYRYATVTEEDDGNGNDDDDDDRLPPHEWIAKKLARSRITSFSVCEGAGRTLKGRDQRKVRNAVLTGTGFLE
ncbi:uncharacterized protein A4U43_C07F37880 [Asparagus officinalis]|uniref:Senescence regulator S40 n=1 Tax=Asparagus officinalis TaxID=4686 RepID=A0A5P1EID6_ASPOF|nr:uncharacterized protein LOC109850930 [Asparagus officinalis]ONK65513.1 uncharacterized protein A4U43_C07F37880 [Asparagus officinalis]